MDTIREITQQYFRTDLPPLRVGDKVEITTKNYNKNEKDKNDGTLKHRLTHFKGTVITQKNPGQISYTFSVLKESKGSEKVAIRSIFSYHSPLIVSIKKIGQINQKVRRAKLYYLERDGVIVILGIGTIIYFAGPKNNSVGNKKQTSWEEETSHLKIQLNSVKNELKNLSDNTQKSQLENKLTEIENKVNKITKQDNSPQQSDIKKLEQEIKNIKKKIESNKPDKSPDPSDTPNNPPLPEQPNDKYPALIATKRELEYKVNPPLAISSVGTDYNQLSETNKNSLLPGSALLTDTLDGLGGGSSPLDSKGIANIIHAAPWPRDLFKSDEDFINCVVKSVQNSIILAERNNFEKLAIPLVGGGIYLGSCDPQKLAEGIIRGAINQLEKCQKLKKIIFID
ncbi:3637_t:CDS:2 [Scutellospora calospora]|uniref:3637_t:CDS:1 n=1 Tax=Scutellospora calospora TaxID=85575 RepID=A0ACA9MB21_9GLOM|nr:3637_t:CDS:2 [Scutellospora calospora]